MQQNISFHPVSERQRHHNETLYILRYISMTTSTHLTSGAFASAFMLYIGFSTQMISHVNFAATLGLFVASVLVIFAYNWDKSGLGIVRIGSFINILMPFSMLIASFLYIKTLRGAYLALTVLYFIANTAYSMRNSAEINAVPLLFGRSRYAIVMARCGYLGGMATLAVSLLTMFILKSDESIGYYQVYFFISTGLMLIYAFLTLFFRRPPDFKSENQVHTDFKKVFTKKYLLASLPHITRGIGAAALTLWPATVMSNLPMTPLYSSLLIPTAIIGEIIGSFCFSRLIKVLKPGIMTLIGFSISAAFMLMTPLIRTIPFFFVCYFLYSFSMSGFGKALMQCFVYACDEEELALMSSLHVLYYAIAFSPAVLILGKFMDNHTMLCMSICAVIYVISGILFHVFYRKPVEEKET